MNFQIVNSKTILDRQIGPFQRLVAGLTATALLITQVVIPTAQAAPLGSSTVSAGSVPPPTATAIQSFQPDLFTGRATTSIPLAIPPGRKGLQPNLALAYSSSARNSWVGVGWSLDIGYIERSTKNGVPKYDTTDTYTFMFQGVASDLVQIPDGTYRAKDEGLFLKFVNNGVSGWEVRDKSGTRYFFGQTVASQIEETGNAFRWALDKVLDVNGNTLSLTYVKNQAQLYPTQIDYTGHEPTSLAPVNRVTFTLEDRPDDETSYRSGFTVTTAKRLKEVAAYAPDPQAQPLQLARKYVLAYTVSGRTGRSLLSSVTQFGTNGTSSVPATVLTYQAAGAAAYPNLLTNIQSPPSVAAWNVRKAGLDTGHENFGCVHPYAGLPWGSPVQASGSFDLGCLSGSVNGSGDLTISGCQDHFGHAWTYIYVDSPQSLSLSTTNGGCLYKEDAGGVSQITSGSASLQTGWSIIHLTNYHQHEGWGASVLNGIMSQVDVMRPDQIALGIPQLVGDVNGDARTDLVKFDPQNGSWTVSLATASALAPGSSWLSGFGGSASAPLVGDWNGDGKTDIATFSSGTWQFATSTGTGFQTGAISGLSFGSGTPLIGDINGDAVTDLGTYNNGTWTFALGTGSGFTTSAGSFNLTWGNSSQDALTGDFNGDGLTDIGLVDKTTGTVDIRLSTGRTSTGWTTASPWVSNFGGSNPHTSADFNGDGLTDAAYYNRAVGQVIYAPATGSAFGSPVTLPITFTLTATDDTIQVGDFNGDGLADPAAFNLLSGSSQLALSSLMNADGSHGSATDALRTIANGLGGLTTLTYQPATLCGCQEESVLPFVLHVIQQASQADGMGNTYTTTYQFHDGAYDGATKEFRGFATATVFDANGNKTITEFYQDDLKKGRPIRTEFRDQFDALWTNTEQTWSVSQPYAGVSFVRLDQTDSAVYDGDAGFKQVRSRFQYDSYGNVSRTDADGEVGVSGDERATVTQFTYNTTDWILNKPKLVQALDVAQAVVAQRRFYYDGAASIDTAPPLGRLTKEEEWLNPGDRWLATTLAYDAYGNVTSVTDAESHVATNTYDATKTYLIKIANHLLHEREMTYDPRFGQVTSTTDQNDQVTTTEYDVLGRVTKVIGPNDTSTDPTVSYAYDPCLATAACTPPIRSTVQTRIHSGQAPVLTAYAFVDGLGRTIQTRSPAENPAKQIVTGAVEFNNLGQVIKQWAPYEDDALDTYRSHTLVSGLAPPAQYTYDPLGRTLTVQAPDGAVTSTSYDDWTVTATDANTRQTRRFQDAYGRLVKVEEVNGGATYTTTYAYDALNNLATVTDAQGNVTQITYDSLGRKLSMDDPDMGDWTYAYDDVDNLESQTDARGVVTTFTYDALNRLAGKSYTIPQGSGIPNPGNVTYTYDGTNDPSKPFAKGKLTKVTDGSGWSSFEYDNLGRLIKETKSVTGEASPFVIERTYDLLGRLETLTYPDATAATYTYNSQGGIETIQLGSQAIVSGMTYNAAGQIQQITYGNGVTTDYTYDVETLRLDRLLTTGPGGALQDLRYTFDLVGNVTEIQDFVNTADQTFQYDALNRLIQASGAYGNLTYQYDAIGNMTQKEGVTMTYPAASNPRPHAVTATSAGWALTYDANGNMTKKITNPIAEDLTAQELTYDAENRLTQAETAQEATVELHFQPGWNFFSLPVIPDDAHITSVFGSSFSQNFEQVAWYDPAVGVPELERFKHFVNNADFNDFDILEYGRGYQTYCKNPNGVTIQLTGRVPTNQASTNLLQEWHLLPAIATDGNQPLSWLLQGVNYDQVLRWDAQTQQLQTATQVAAGEAYFVHVTSTSSFTPPLPEDQTTTFVYDGDGGRVKKVTASGATTFLGQSFEKAPDGTTTTYVFAGDLRVAAKDSTGDLKFYHGDHLGSSNVITNGQGQQVELAEYTPFGSLSRQEGTADVPQKFTGQRLDLETGIYFYGGRYYDSSLGRFIQADPFIQDPADPQTLNRYAYVRNNPANLVDPSGYWSFRINIFGFGFEIGSERASISIGGLTVGYDWEQNEVLLGIRVGLEIGPVGGSFQAAFFYNASQQQAGVSYEVVGAGASAEARAYYDFRENQLGAGVRTEVPFGHIAANTDGQRSLTLAGQSIRVKAAKAGQAVFVDVYSRPLDNDFSRATGWPRHMFIVYDNGTKLWELENRNGRISFPKRTPEEVGAYFGRWEDQLKGPLTVTVDRADFERALSAQEARAGQPYRADYKNSNYAVRSVIQQSITYGIGPVPKESLGGPRGAPGGLGDFLSGSVQ